MNQKEVFTYLSFEINEKNFLCKEKDLEKVFLVSKTNIYKSFIGSEKIKSLLVNDEEIIPLFGGDFKNESNDALVVVVKRGVELAGVIVDKIKNYVSFEKDILNDALDVPMFLADKALNFNGEEFYFLNTDALFEGKELL